MLRNPHAAPRVLRFAVCTNPRNPSRLYCFAYRIEGVNVIPTSIPSGETKRLTVWPQGSFLFRISIR